MEWYSLGKYGWNSITITFKIKNHEQTTDERFHRLEHRAARR